MLTRAEPSSYFPLQSPIATGVALGGIGKQILQLFHYANTGGFLQLPLESRECDSSCLSIMPRYSPATIETMEEQHIQRIRNKEKVKNRFWLAQERREDNGEWELEGRTKTK